MKKISLSAIMLIFSIITLFGQKQQDVLYLKNGSIISGKLMEVSDNQYKIKARDESLFIFSSAEVDKFVNETKLYDGRKKRGLGFALEAGVLIGEQTSEYKAPFSFNIIGNITSNVRSIFGIGSGVEYLGKSFTPLFLEYKYLISAKKTAPFVFFRAGKLFNLKGHDENSDYIYSGSDYEKSYSGGASFTIGTGISWSKEDSESYLSFAYRYAHTSYSQADYYHMRTTYQSDYNRLEVKIGFKF
jgi:hypothetical protein